INLDRYMGRWYLVADSPYLNERDYVGTYEEWSIEPDGSIAEKKVSRRFGFDQPATSDTFTANVIPGTHNSTCRVQILWPFEFVVRTVYVDPDYKYTIRCMEDGSFVRIFSRDPNVDGKTYDSLLVRARELGLSTHHMQRVPQSSGEIGQAGFRSLTPAAAE